MNLLAGFGLVAGAMAVVDTFPYIRDTLRGNTRPHRGTWLIWSVLAAVAFFSQLADGASWSLGMVGGQSIVTLAVFALSLHFGVGAGRNEVGLMIIALVGVAGWFVISAPIVATISVVLADLIGLLLMLPKTYRDPYSETLVTFALSSVGGVLGALAVGSWDPALLVYPMYFAAMNLFVAALLAIRREMLGDAARPVPGGVSP